MDTLSQCRDISCMDGPAAQAVSAAKPEMTVTVVAATAVSLVDKSIDLHIHLKLTKQVI
jgi:hypothetical protein